MEELKIKNIGKQPKWIETAAHWFAEKWDIPFEAYLESMKSSAVDKKGVPQWYIVLNNKQEIIAGAGVIENDFHERVDLTPNLCALFVEKPYRQKGIAKRLLNDIKKDLSSLGFEKIYLITDHTNFYEKYDWEFLTTVKDDEGNVVRMYVTSILNE